MKNEKMDFNRLLTAKVMKAASAKLRVRLEEDVDDNDLPDLTLSECGSECSDSVHSCSAFEEELQSIRQANKPTRPSLSWGSIQIRSYPIIAGSHPCTSEGASLTVDWEPFDEQTTNIDRYESRRNPRRRSHELVLNSWERYQILRRSGATNEELTLAVRQTQQIKSERDESLKRTRQPLTGLDELKKNMIRTVKHAFRF
jgi:hypothetical protein